jgi:hypothetical protein
MARLTLYVPDAPEGAAHLVSRALPQLGCGGLDRAAFEALKDRQGVLSRAESGLGRVSWTFESLPANAEMMVQLLADESLRPAWSRSADLPEVLARIWEEGQAQDDGDAAARAFRAAAGDPVADPPPAAPMGEDAFVETWRSAVRRPARAVLAVVGDIESIPLRRAIAQHFGPWEGVGRAADPPPDRRTADTPPDRLGADTPPGRTGADAPLGRTGADPPPSRTAADPSPGRRGADPSPGRWGADTPPDRRTAGTPPGRPRGKETPKTPAPTVPPETPEVPVPPETRRPPARRVVVNSPAAPQVWVAWDLGALEGAGGAEALAGLIPWLLKTALLVQDEAARGLEMGLGPDLEIDPGGRWIRAAGFGGAPPAEARLKALLARPLTQAWLDAALAARDEYAAADALHPARMLDRLGDPAPPCPPPGTLEELRTALGRCMGADNLRVLIVAPPAPAR